MSLRVGGKDPITGMFRHGRAGELFLTYESYTPTGAWTTNTTYDGTFRVIGDTLESIVSVQLSGAPTTTSTDGKLQISLPPGFSIDTSKLSAENRVPLGNATLFDSLGNWYAASVVWYNTLDDNEVEIVYHTISSNLVTVTAVTDTAPFAWGSGDKVDLHYSVPIIS